LNGTAMLCNETTLCHWIITSHHKKLHLHGAI